MNTRIQTNAATPALDHAQPPQPVEKLTVRKQTTPALISVLKVLFLAFSSKYLPTALSATRSLRLWTHPILVCVCSLCLTTIDYSRHGHVVIERLG